MGPLDLLSMPGSFDGCNRGDDATAHLGNVVIGPEVQQCSTLTNCPALGSRHGLHALIGISGEKTFVLSLCFSVARTKYCICR
jgi:hypothetical protein